MKAIILHEINGVQTTTVEGYYISTDLRPGGLALVVVKDEQGREVRVIHLSNVYAMDKERRGTRATPSFRAMGASVWSGRSSHYPTGRQHLRRLDLRRITPAPGE